MLKQFAVSVVFWTPRPRILVVVLKTTNTRYRPTKREESKSRQRHRPCNPQKSFGPKKCTIASQSAIRPTGSRRQARGRTATWYSAPKTSYQFVQRTSWAKQMLQQHYHIDARKTKTQAKGAETLSGFSIECGLVRIRSERDHPRQRLGHTHTVRPKSRLSRWLVRRRTHSRHAPLRLKVFTNFISGFGLDTSSCLLT